MPNITIAVGDLVVRKSHGHDIVFKVTDIYVDEITRKNHCLLRGMHMRLIADAPIDDVEKISAEDLRNEIVRIESIHQDKIRQVMVRRCLEKSRVELYRSEQSKKFSYFEVPGKVLHIDGDEEYLRMCLKTYNQLNIEAVGRHVEESRQPDVVAQLLKEFRPDILIVTGHDALLGGNKDLKDVNSYRHSKYYIQSVINARNFVPSRDDLVIFSGACQSYFEAILQSGANFASAPNRIFIHAYDPVFIAEKVAFTPINKIVDINEAITASVTGIEGVGGVETRGKFRLGLPKTK